MESNGATDTMGTGLKPDVDGGGPSPRRALILLLIILAAATALRLRHIGDPPSLDELWSLELSTGRGSVQLDLPANEMFPAPAMTELADAPPARAIWTSLDRVTHPPLYFLTLRGWRDVFGAGDVAARWLSLAASLASIVLLYDAVRLLTASRVVALWSVALFAVAEPQVDHARLVRGYTLLLMFGVLAWWAVARLRVMQPFTATRPWRTLGCAVVLGGATLGLLLTHYFAVGAVGALFLFALLSLRGKARRYAAFAVFGGVCIFIFLWGPTLARHAHHFSGSDSTTEFLRRDTMGLTRLSDTLNDLDIAPLRLLLDLPVRTLEWAWVAGIASAVVFVLIIRKRRTGVLLPILWLFGTIGFVMVLDLGRSTTQLREVRYLLLASPGLYVLLACTTARSVTGIGIRRITRHALPGIALLACVARDVGPQRPPEFDWRPIAAFLDEPSRAGDPIVFSHAGQADWFLGQLVMSYRHASHQPPGRGMLVLEGELPKRASGKLATYGHAWAISFPERIPNVERALPGWSVIPAEIPGMPRMVWELTPNP